MKHARRRSRSGASSKTRLRRRVGTLALLVVFSGVVGLAAFQLAFSHSYSSYVTSPWVRSESGLGLTRFANAFAPDRGHRLIYPYSVVPGGVQSAAELKHASDSDRVVAQHYAGFDYAHARVVEVREPRLVYLSYRMHDHIYWTSKQIRLHRGEKLISDGRLTARARCGNQVSDTAQKAVSREEPPAEKFEQPFVGDGGTGTQASPTEFASTLAAPHGDGDGGTAPVSSSYLFGPGGSTGYPPVFPPPIPFNSFSCGSLDPGAVNHHCPKHPGTGGGPTPPPPPPPPPPAVPEPTTLLLFGSGAVGVYLRYRRKK